MDNPSSALRFGVLGVGKIATTRFLPAAAQVSSVRVTALGTRSPERLAVAQLPVHPSTQVLTYETLVREGRNLVDGVYIALPNDLHEEWVHRCAEAGLHVLCEKPLAGTVEAARRCRAACQQHGVLLVEAFMYRHDPRHQRVRDLIQTDRVGRVHLLEVSFSYLLEDLGNIRLQPDRSGGALMDVGCYGIDLARYLFAEEPTEVTARGIRGARSGVDELTVATLVFASGIMAVVTASTHLARSQTYQVRGTEGTIVVPTAFVPSETDPTQVVMERTGEERHVEEFPPMSVYVNQLAHFVRAAKANDAALLPPAEDGVANAQVLEAAVRSLGE